MTKPQKTKLQQLEAAGIDHDAANHEMVKQCHLVNMIAKSCYKLEVLLKGMFIHEIKQKVMGVLKASNLVLNNSDRLLGFNQDFFEDCSVFLDEFTDLALECNTEEKRIKAISSLKLIVGKS